VYNQIKEETLAPWRPARKCLPGRFKNGCTDRLEKLSRQRTKLYHRASRSKNDRDWEAYREIDKTFKQSVTRHQRAQRDRLAGDALDTDPTAVQRKFGAMLGAAATPGAPTNEPADNAEVL